ncbi:hypothetical protein RRSWK_03466 [Rhodopirellula sp. SWK7]|nr:hypothetical protein RRSWK_03466 [Rhodopirellula sp. SWK7]
MGDVLEKGFGTLMRSNEGGGTTCIGVRIVAIRCQVFALSTDNAELGQNMDTEELHRKR